MVQLDRWYELKATTPEFMWKNLRVATAYMCVCVCDIMT